MFEKMADMLEGEPEVVEELMQLLDKSNGNLVRPSLSLYLRLYLSSLS